MFPVTVDRETSPGPKWSVNMTVTAISIETPVPQKSGSVNASVKVPWSLVARAARAGAAEPTNSKPESATA